MQQQKYGKVYSTANAQEMLDLVRREGGYMYQTHPRTKGSTDFRQDCCDRSLSGSRDTSAPGGRRCRQICRLPAGRSLVRPVDDLSNQGLRKRIFGEVDMFQFDHTDELYAT